MYKEFEKEFWSKMNMADRNVWDAYRLVGSVLNLVEKERDNIPSYVGDSLLKKLEDMGKSLLDVFRAIEVIDELFEKWRRRGEE